MANLQSTTVLTFNACTCIAAPSILNTSVGSVQQWAGYVGVPTPYYNPTGNYVNLLSNVNGYAWITGYISMPANQSYNTAHDFWFALSRYGLKYTWGASNDGLMSLHHYQDPGNANINYLRVCNQYNASWAYANYHVNATVFTGCSNAAIASSYITRVN